MLVKLEYMYNKHVQLFINCIISSKISHFRIVTDFQIFDKKQEDIAICPSVSTIVQFDSVVLLFFMFVSRCI